MRRWLPAALVALASRAEGQGLRDIDTTFARWRAGPPRAAVAIAVVHRDSLVYHNVAGYADLERGVPATHRTRFDWASIGKQFTAFGVSLLVDRGRLAPTDDVRARIPELDLDGARITIDQLLHHTAGLQDADGLYALAGGRSTDPVSHREMVELLVRQRTLRFAPGTQHAYSNGGYSLLAEVIARAVGDDFVNWSDSAIFRRMGMHESGFLRTPHAMVPNRALPYIQAVNAGRAWVPSTSDTYPAAGGLYATVDDMARWARQLLRPRAEARATQRLFERGRLASGDSIGYAWGIAHGQYRGRATLSHGGSGPATSAFLMLIPELDFGVVVAVAGEGDANVGTLAHRAADAVLGKALGPRPDTSRAGQRMLMMTDEMLNTPPPEARGIATDAGTLRLFAGKYRLADSTIIVVRAIGDSLAMSYDGRPPYIPLFPLGGERFVMMPLWDVYRFTTGADGTVGLSRESVRQSLRQRPTSAGRRLPETRFDARTAAPYVGSYYSDELRALYGVELGRNGSLVLTHARFGTMALMPLEGERFAVDGPGIVGATFARAGDRMVGLELEARSWGVRVSFRRVALVP